MKQETPVLELDAVIPVNTGYTAKGLESDIVISNTGHISEYGVNPKDNWRERHNNRALNFTRTSYKEKIVDLHICTMEHRKGSGPYMRLSGIVTVRYPRYSIHTLHATKEGFKAVLVTTEGETDDYLVLQGTHLDTLSVVRDSKLIRA